MRFFQGTIIVILFTLVSNPLKGQVDTTRKGRLTLNVGEGIAEMHQKYVDGNKENEELDGYRVQIYNGRRAACLKSRSNFMMAYPAIEAYLLYEAPEYKTQVGDFRTRLEAERFLRDLSEDFAGSFVVKTKIKFPKLEHLDTDINLSETKEP